MLALHMHSWCLAALFSPHRFNKSADLIKEVMDGYYDMVPIAGMGRFHVFLPVSLSASGPNTCASNPGRLFLSSSQLLSSCPYCCTVIQGHMQFLTLNSRRD